MPASARAVRPGRSSTTTERPCRTGGAGAGRRAGSARASAWPPSWDPRDGLLINLTFHGDPNGLVIAWVLRTAEPPPARKLRSRAGDGRVGLYAGFCPRAPRGLPMGGHPSRPAVAGRLERSTRRHRAGSPRTPARNDVAAVPSRPCSGWGLPSHTGHPVRGGLLHRRFTLASARAGGLFSVALSRGSPRVAVSDHPALWSPDVPRRRGLPRRRDRPADSSVVPASLVTGLSPSRAGSRPVAARPRSSSPCRRSAAPAPRPVGRRAARG